MVFPTSTLFVVFIRAFVTQIHATYVAAWAQTGDVWHQTAASLCGWAAL